MMNLCLSKTSDSNFKKSLKPSWKQVTAVQSSLEYFKKWKCKNSFLKKFNVKKAKNLQQSSQTMSSSNPQSITVVQKALSALVSHHLPQVPMPSMKPCTLLPILKVCQRSNFSFLKVLHQQSPPLLKDNSFSLHSLVHLTLVGQGTIDTIANGQ